MTRSGGGYLARKRGGEGYCFATLGESVCTTNVAKCSKHIVRCSVKEFMVVE